ncbi:MAG: ABC transporter ATP-binding protein [Treponema sp.]|nr:ABC transporter ATP-binding protein [Treponema sp.]
MGDYENAIEISGITKQYDGFRLDSVDITVPKGTVMGFVGQNGAGKTTTFRALLGTMKPDSGSIKIFGMDINEHEKEIKEKIAVVFDDLPFHDNLNARQLNIILRDLFENWDEKTFFSYLQRFQLPEKKKFSTFSRGMKMKLQIAVALSHEADLLILDEATAGLDPVVRSEILDVFMEFMQDENHSILMSSHITSDLERLADMLTFIHDGKIILSGYKDEILEDHAVLKCSRENLADIDPGDIVSIRVSSFACDVMIRNRLECPDKYRNFVTERPPLDEILLFHVRGIKSKEWSL